MKDLGSRLTAMALFVRDRIAQGAADFLVVHLGIGPFGVATGALRVAAVLQAATITTRVISGHLQWSSVLDVAMAAVFCWVCIVWARLTAAAAQRPPRFGSVTASALRRDEYLSLVLMIVAFLAWDLWDLGAGSSFEEALTTASDLIQGLGFLLGSTIWRVLPRSGRRTPVPAASAS